MIRRAMVGLLVAGLSVGAALLPTPPGPTSAQAPEPLPTSPPLEASAGISVSYCPWARSDDRLNSLVTAASLVPAGVALSLPAGGERGEGTEERLPGPAAVPLPLRAIRAGDAGAVVEISEGPAAASVLVHGRDVLAGDLCPGSIPKVWQLAGGSTRKGERLTLRLFNPFPEDANLTISAVSEFGIEAPPEFEALSVASRGWKDVNVSELLPLRERLAMTVIIDRGLVIPALVLTEGTDRAVWPGSGQSAQWEFPLVRTGGLRPVLAVSNPAPTDVNVVLDVFTDRGTLPAAVSEVVKGGSELRMTLRGLAEGDFGLRLEADGPVSAVMVGRAEGRRAATPGAPRTARRWIVPGFGVDARGDQVLWVLNSGAEPTTVTFVPLGSAGTVGGSEKVPVPPGTIRRVVIDKPGMAGLVAEALEPISLAWSVVGETSVAYMSAAPIDE